MTIVGLHYTCVLVVTCCSNMYSNWKPKTSLHGLKNYIM